MLDIFERLNRGELLNKQDMVRYYGVGGKTIQRDIEDIRSYLADRRDVHVSATIEYDRGAKGYRLTRFEREWLTNQETLALCKILLESRALEKTELRGLIEKLLTQASPSDRAIAEDIIRGEYAAYVPLRHGKKLLESLWRISLAIHRHREISFFYTRKDGVSHQRTVKPLSIMFSEYYFYVIALYDDADEGEVYRTFRIDRLADLKETGKSFRIPHNAKFHDGEFRKRVQYMYDGKMQTIRFKYHDSSIEHVLDRLPTAKAKKVADGVYEVTAEVSGKGILIWLLSQGSQVEVNAPRELREEWLSEINRM
ncbi:MAG: WYL domain-containing protein, partial [Schwartzia sp.]|nr:WYL domain-containing protein [Schwartzia sp. (in: firmicutes)]